MNSIKLLCNVYVLSAKFELLIKWNQNNVLDERNQSVDVKAVLIEPVSAVSNEWCWKVMPKFT